MDDIEPAPVPKRPGAPPGGAPPPPPPGRIGQVSEPAGGPLFEHDGLLFLPE
ncbi:hypothetical protein GSH05_17615, partial [Burkholderia pseudomallei]|nr:hypothetical protein [Burkholderia pseudomallei]